MKQTFAIAILAWAMVSSPRVASASTTFFKAGDTVEIVTTDYSGTTYLLYEENNKKYKVEFCSCDCTVYSHRHLWKHVRFRMAPGVNSATFAIFSEGRLVKTPMPTFKNGGPIFPPNVRYERPCPHQHHTPVCYDEFEIKDQSKEEPALEVSYQAFSGGSVRQTYTGKEQIGELFKHLTTMIDEMPVDAAPQYANVFGTGDILVAKSDVIELKTEVKGVISAFNLKTINANAAATPEQQPADAFTGTGPQGKATFDFSQNGGAFTIRNGEDVFRTKWTRYTAKRVYAHADFVKAVGGKPSFTVFPPSPTLAKMLDYGAKSRNVAVGEVVVFQNRAGKMVAVRVAEIKDKQSGAPENSLTIHWKIL